MKNYTLALVWILLLYSSATFAGDRQQNRIYRQQIFSNPGHGQFPDAVNPFFSEHFATGLPAGWKSTDSSGSGIKWHYTTSGANNGIDSLSNNGTTAANGYMIYDSDSAGHPVGGENSDLISDSINCSTHSNVHLNFNEFLTYYNDTATVHISTDGVTWTEVHNSSAGLGQFQSTPNPNNVDIDISAIAANMPKVYIRFNYRADYSFFWMIDDVQLYQAPAIEATLAEIVMPESNCMILTASEPVVINIFNSGGDSIAGGLNVTYSVDGGTPVTEAVTDTIPPATTLTYNFSALANLSIPGNHLITAYLSLTGDTIATNDTIRKFIHVGPYFVNTVDNYTNGFETAAELEGLSAEDGNNDSITWTNSNIFPYAGNSCMEIGSVTANDWLFTQCLDLDAGIVYKLSYYYRVNGTSSQARLQVMVGLSPSSTAMVQELLPSTLYSNIFYLPITYQFNVAPTGTYYVGFRVVNGDSAITGFRLDNVSIVADSGVGISNLDKLPLAIFPNPTKGIVHINSSETFSKGYKIEVLNSVGQIISESFTNELNDFTIDLNTEPTGVYLVRIVSDSGVETRKLTISR